MNCCGSPGFRFLGAQPLRAAQRGQESRGGVCSAHRCAAQAAVKPEAGSTLTHPPLVLQHFLLHAVRAEGRADRACNARRQAQLVCHAAPHPGAPHRPSLLPAPAVHHPVCAPERAATICQSASSTSTTDTSSTTFVVLTTCTCGASTPKLGGAAAPGHAHKADPACKSGPGQRPSARTWHSERSTSRRAPSATLPSSTKPSPLILMGVTEATIPEAVDADIVLAMAAVDFCWLKAGMTVHIPGCTGRHAHPQSGAGPRAGVQQQLRGAPTAPASSATARAGLRWSSLPARRTAPSCVGSAQRTQSQPGRALASAAHHSARSAAGVALTWGCRSTASAACRRPAAQPEGRPAVPA